MLFRHQPVCWRLLIAIAICCSFHSKAKSAEGKISSMPVREVTIFKDGHAFMHHEGKVKTDANGHVNLDDLPSPVLGTFWSYSVEENVKLKSVTAGKQRVTLKQTALSIIDLIKANIGAEAIIQEQAESGKQKPLSYRATLLSIPTRSAEEVEATSPLASGPHLPVLGSTILLKTEQGTKAINMNTIRNITFLKDAKTEVTSHEIRTRLRLHLDWGKAKPKAEAHVGMTYLQKGIRWIPHYNLTLNDDGTVKVQLQATLINELTNLENVTAHLLVGVPHIEFKATIDPIAMHQQGIQLSRYFANAPANNSGRAMMSNSAIMTQSQGSGGFFNPNPHPHAEVEGVKLPGSEKNGELFTFTLKNITLAKGERTVVSVGEWTMKYKNVYKLHIPSMPSDEARQYFNTHQPSDLAKAMHAPKVKKTLRIINNQPAPFTTAPALIQSTKGLLAQGMMTYTPAGGTVDITITTAINVPVKQRDDVIDQKMDNLVFNRSHYNRTSLKSEIHITNFNKEAIPLEVTRMTIGKADSADEEGTISNPTNWGHWSRQLNTQSQISWNKTLKPKETIKLHAQWHFFWN